MIETNGLLIDGKARSKRKRNRRLLQGLGPEHLEEQVYRCLRRCRLRRWKKTRSLFGDMFSLRCPLNIYMNISSWPLDNEVSQERVPRHKFGSHQCIGRKS